MNRKTHNQAALPVHRTPGCPPDFDAGAVRFSGDMKLLARARRAILISRTERKVTPDTAWVRCLVQSVKDMNARDEVLVTSLGRTPFDVALVTCKQLDGAAIVILDPSRSRESWMRYAKGMLPERCLIVDPTTALKGRSKRTKGMPLRDFLFAEYADRGVAIHVREGGNMAQVILTLRLKGCEVERLGGPATGKAPAHPSMARMLTRKPDAVTDRWDYLTHYTREPDGPWPEETPAAFASWLSTGEASRTREAGDSLRRILEMNRIQGSGRLMPGRTPMVSLTERAPWEMNELVRWRTSFRRWSFRPYGVAIRRSCLEALGARKVRYLSEAECTQLAPRERLFAQKHEPPQTDWSGEAEWRLPDALSLREIPKEAVCVLAPTKAEAEEIGATFGFDSLAVCAGP